MVTRKTPAARIALVAAFLVLALALVPASFAGKGKPGGGGGSTGGTSTIAVSMVTDQNGDGLPNWGDTVTFNVSSTATTEPHVSLKCYQAGTLVYTTQTGYFAGYMWPWTQIMTLSSGAWTGGAASCTAALYYFSGSKTVTLKTLTFAAGA